MIQSSSERGKFVISFDLELGWGSIENGLWKRLQDQGVFQQLRHSLMRLLDAMDEAEVAGTWGVVGCLLAEAEQRDFSHLPPPLRSQVVAFLEEAAPETYAGGDLVEMIADSNVAHTFCSHTYSHTRLGYPGVDESVVATELARFKAVFPRTLNWSDSLIFPLNQEGYFDQVMEAGFRLVRGKDQDPKKRSLVSKSLELIQTPPLSQRNEVMPGLWRETDSMLFNTGRRRWKLPFVSRRARAGLQLAVRKAGTFHVWTHPFDLASEPETLDALIELIRYVAELRDRGHLDVGSMSPMEPVEIE
ncbi:MAG: hypothetical protein AAF497_07785 [Planctomycetota bacterium]